MTLPFPCRCLGESRLIDWTLDDVHRAPRVIVACVGVRGRSVLRMLDKADGECSVPIARLGSADKRALNARRLPALIYFEHGEALERAEGPAARDVAGFLATVEALQEQWRPRNGRLRVDRFG